MESAPIRRAASAPLRNSRITRSGNRSSSFLRPHGPAIHPARGNAPGLSALASEGLKARPFAGENRTVGPSGLASREDAGTRAFSPGWKNGQPFGPEERLSAGAKRVVGEISLSRWRTSRNLPVRLPKSPEGVWSPSYAESPGILAPKGLDSIAQGAALGNVSTFIRSRPNGPSPAGEVEWRPTGPLRKSAVRFPKTAPWAFESGPVGAEERKPSMTCPTKVPVAWALAHAKAIFSGKRRLKPT